ncbi:MAG: sigma-70 family RNA polymerase sigma factor [Vallitalea sp.]|jgi:RNA polymerase sigma-70 factor (ECF subfamily)|nr:sigma-70 family RNA polymerase sigma factor [Vallitalea sp.]
MISIRDNALDECIDNEIYLKKLMDIYGTQLKRYAYIMLKDEYLAEDAVQKTFINFYYKINTYRHESSEKNYLYTILVNECKQIKRKNWFKKEKSDNDKQFELLCDSEEVKSDNKIVVNECLLKIKPKYREIILLYYYQSFSVIEICEILNLSSSAVKSRLRYARENLKKYLQEVFDYE